MFKLGLRHLVVSVLLILGKSKNTNAFFDDLFGFDDDTDEDYSDYGFFHIFASILGFFDDDSSSDESDEDRNNKTVFLCKNCVVNIQTDNNGGNGSLTPQAGESLNKTSNKISGVIGPTPHDKGVSNGTDTNKDIASNVTDSLDPLILNPSSTPQTDPQNSKEDPNKDGLDPSTADPLATTDVNAAG